MMPLHWQSALASLLALAASADLAAPVLDYDFAGRGNVGAVEALLRRTLRLEEGAAFPFKLEMSSTCRGEKPAASRSSLCFELGDADDGSSTILVRGTSGIDLARGAAHYLRAYCNMSFSWVRGGGNQVALPSKWPKVGETVVQWRLRDISYGFNVCTFSYSNVWYGFDGASPGSKQLGESWENLIDYMALSGINLALAYTGQEEVYRKVFEEFGVASSEFAAWSNGPAHLTWSRGQSMHNIGGPLPLAWMKGQWELQRKIVARMRDLGMVPVLPAFQGNVPPVMKRRHPDANITVQGANVQSGPAAWLDATDPLFQAIGDRFMREVISDFGVDTDGDGLGDETDHWYEADGYFAAGNPPWLSRRRAEGGEAPSAVDENARLHASRAYLAMNKTDPKAMWLYQGWILHDGAHDLSVMRGYAAAVPRGRLLVSDMWSEWAPISKMLSEAGVPYLYGVLQNFGGTLEMGMSTVVLNSGAPEDPKAAPSVFEALAEREGGMGVGAFPEGIDQNPAYYSFLFDANWMAAPADLTAWWRRYAVERYGRESQHAVSAWQKLGSTVYSIDPRRGSSPWREKAHGGLLSAPLMNDYYDQPVGDWYNVSLVLEAWRHLVAAASELPAGLSTLRYDLANVGREVLDKLANRRFPALLRANSTAAAFAAGRRQLELLRDADGLLCSCAEISMDAWLKAAQALGASHGGLADFYDAVARAQVTTWLPACGPGSDGLAEVCAKHRSPGSESSSLEDYANKAWGGMVGQYYAGRIGCFLKQWGANSTKADVKAFDACLDDFNYAFQHDANRTKFPICEAPVGDAAVISAALIEKYGAEVDGRPGTGVESARLYV